MRAVAEVALTTEQARAAERGWKGLMPVLGKPLLEHSLAALAAAGISRACVVRSPDDLALETWAKRWNAERHGENPGRPEVSTRIQPEPRGTADALLAAEDWILPGQEPFLLLNADTYYPASALRRLAGLSGPGLLALEREPFLAARHSNIPAERLRSFAVVDAEPRKGGGTARLRGLLEKPDPATYRSLPEPVLLSINAWRFSSMIFSACRAISASPRGELELPDAVLHAIRHLGVDFEVLPTAAAVLDLTGREDIPELEARLREVSDTA